MRLRDIALCLALTFPILSTWQITNQIKTAQTESRESLVAIKTDVAKLQEQMILDREKANVKFYTKANQLDLEIYKSYATLLNTGNQ